MSWQIKLDEHKNAIMIPVQSEVQFKFLTPNELLQLNEKQLEDYYKQLEYQIMYHKNEYEQFLRETEDDEMEAFIEQEYYDTTDSDSELV